MMMTGGVRLQALVMITARMIIVAQILRRAVVQPRVHRGDMCYVQNSRHLIMLLQCRYACVGLIAQSLSPR